mmetsp:Transcript_40965/g.98786  ORF Transcript_40965/g.98786 Transcript_40965/m.98786 type:complete len:112 (+) Transcript_40965:388-723(+)
MSTVANGVLVTDAWVAAIKHMTASGTTGEMLDVAELNNEQVACARGAAAKKSGKIMPPGNFPAQARAIEISFATPTCTAAEADAKGRLGFTRAWLVKKLESPCLVAAKAVD